MGVSKNNGTPQIIHFDRFSIIGTTFFGNTRILITWIFTFPVLEIVSGIFLGWGIFFWGKKMGQLSAKFGISEIPRKALFFLVNHVKPFGGVFGLVRRNGLPQIGCKLFWMCFWWVN